MMPVKRAKLNSEDRQVDVISSCQLDMANARVIGLPPGTGNITAISPGAESVPYIAVGTDKGAVVIVVAADSEQQITTTLEHPGNPAIQRLLLLKPSSAASDNTQLPIAISGDAEGRLSVYQTGQLFWRNTLSAPVSALAVDSNPSSPSKIIVGDLGGAVTTCHLQEIYWRAQIHSLEETLGTDPEIKSVASVRFPDDHDILTGYVLASTENNCIHVISRGHSVMKVPLPASCNSMCTGLFVEKRTDHQNHNVLQAMVGDETGRLSVLDEFELVPYAQLDYPIVKIVTLPLGAFSGRGGSDAIICMTRSSYFYILQNKEIVGTYSLEQLDSPWPAGISVIYDTSSSDLFGPCVIVGDTATEPSVHIIPIKAEFSK